MGELYQMIIFALKHLEGLHNRTHLRKVDLAPSKNISSLSYTKSMGLSLSPPQEDIGELQQMKIILVICFVYRKINKRP